MNLEMINGDRTRPRSIMVNRTGRRFANEAVSYNSIVGAFHQEDVTAFRYANLPAWLIFDHTYLTTYGSTGRPLHGHHPSVAGGERHSARPRPDTRYPGR